jgi:tripeptide aminopeptidase
MELLKQLFRIHSKSGKEGVMIKFIWNWVKHNEPEAKIIFDKYGNLYITKGESESYPCIAAHMDQVQADHSKDFQAIEARDIIIGYSPKKRQQQGVGGDDKCGIWIGLKCLERYDVMKLAFFVSEETGCDGSRMADMDFFKDVRFVIEPDRRGAHDLITNIMGMPLCDMKFIEDTGYKKFGYKEAEGMMTDIEVLKRNGLPVSCINLSCGYYSPHTDEEFIVKRDLLNCLAFVRHIIENCTEVYPHVEEYERYGEYPYLDDFYDYFYGELYDVLSNDPCLSFRDIEVLYKDVYPEINRETLKTYYEAAKEDVDFYDTTLNK